MEVTSAATDVLVPQELSRPCLAPQPGASERPQAEPQGPAPLRQGAGPNPGDEAGQQGGPGSGPIPTAAPVALDVVPSAALPAPAQPVPIHDLAGCQQAAGEGTPSTPTPTRPHSPPASPALQNVLPAVDQPLSLPGPPRPSDSDPQSLLAIQAISSTLTPPPSASQLPPQADSAPSPSPSSLIPPSPPDLPSPLTPLGRGEVAGVVAQGGAKALAAGTAALPQPHISWTGCLLFTAEMLQQARAALLSPTITAALARADAQTPARDQSLRGLGANRQLVACRTCAAAARSGMLGQGQLVAGVGPPCLPGSLLA